MLRKLTIGVTALAVVAGIFARFKGLGVWPLGWDEYYLAQSIQFVLHSGLPEYPCGGFYSRGVLVQYLAALLQMAGMQPQLAPRAIAAVSSLIALPAAFKIARRSGGLGVALITVTILSISVWEVEIARFGRMYAPFQAVFLWYVVFFLDFTLERRSRALVPMLVLSVTGVLLWEGGALLALTNFLPPLIRHSVDRDSAAWKPTAAELRYLLVAAVIFVPVYWFATVDLRVHGGEPTLPPGYQSADGPATSPLDTGAPPWRFIALHPLWLAAAIIPLAALWPAGRRLIQLRSGWVALLGLAVALGAAMLHQFLLSAVVLVLLLLLRVLDAGTLVTRGRPVLWAMTAFLVFWTLFGLFTGDWHPTQTSVAHTALLLAYEFAHFPDVIREIVVPWVHSLPILGAALLALMAVEIARSVGYGRPPTETERTVLVILIALLAAASVADAPRHETRYVFFLYPLAVIVAVTAVANALRPRLKEHSFAEVAIFVVCLGGFALTEDFRPGHLLRIDSADVAFRQGISAAEAAQYPARSDLSGAAGWLNEHVTPGTDLVINAFPGVDFYYPRANYFFMESTDPRFESWSCRGGSMERWSSLPLLYSVEMLETAAASHAQVWLVIESGRRAHVLDRLAAANPALRYRLAWVGRNPGISIVSLTYAARQEMNYYDRH